MIRAQTAPVAGFSEPHRSFKTTTYAERRSFMERHCDACRSMIGRRCDIERRAATLDAAHSDFPVEWTYDVAGAPTCTAFQPKKGAA